MIAKTLSGEFKGWTPERRDDLSRRLLPIPASFPLIGLAVSNNMVDCNAATAGKEHLRGMLGTPYSACFYFLIQSVIENMERGANNQSLAFIHEDNDYKAEAREAFEALKIGRQVHTGPMTLTFADKSAYVPLQVADALAYEGNKAARDTSRKLRRSLEVMGDTKSVCDISARRTCRGLCSALRACTKRSRLSVAL